MEQKMLFEVDLREAAQDGGKLLSSLAMLGRDAVSAGKLDDWGDQVFADGRVRSALSHLAANPPPALLKAVSGALEGPPIDDEGIRASLGRILGRTMPVVSSGPTKPAPAGAPAKAKPAPPASGYDIAWHKVKGSALTADLFDRIDSMARALGPEVSQRPQKVYIGYFSGKRSFFSLQIQRTKLTVWLSIPPAEAQPWDPSVMRDVSEIGHYGMGDVEYTLSSPEQLPQLELLIKHAYTRRSAGK